jgi:hypothetical protein
MHTALRDSRGSIALRASCGSTAAFVERYSSVPVRILNHLNRQLGLMPSVSLPEAERAATESSHPWLSFPPFTTT